MKAVYREIEIDLDDFSDEDLIEELKARKKLPTFNSPYKDKIFEKIEKLCLADLLKLEQFLEGI